MGLGADASGLVHPLARARESATELVDRLFDREFIRAEQHLAAAGETIQHADSLAEVERLLVEEPMRSLKLASAALFREQDGVFRRRVSAGWDADDAETLSAEEPLLAARFQRRPYALDMADAVHASHVRLPSDLTRPILGVPVGNRRRCYAIPMFTRCDLRVRISVANETKIVYSNIHVAQDALARDKGMLD